MSWLLETFFPLPNTEAEDAKEKFWLLLLDASFIHFQGKIMSSPAKILLSGKIAS